MKYSINNKQIEFVEYEHAHRQRFKEINEQWITRSHTLEEEDIKTLDDPQGYMLDGGGRLFMALCDGYPVGSCGYLNMGNAVYEMIKMAVDEEYRGLQIGKKIGAWSVQKMKEHGAEKLILFSNTEGSAIAVQMYRKLGFTEVPLGESEFQRANIRMEMDLGNLSI